MALDTLATNIPQWLLVIVILWEVLWKGLSMWRAALRKHKVWFIALLLLNTLGILQIIYYFWLSDLKLSKSSPKRAKPKSRSKKTKKKK